MHFPTVNSRQNERKAVFNRGTNLEEIENNINSDSSLSYSSHLTGSVFPLRSYQEPASKRFVVLFWIPIYRRDVIETKFYEDSMKLNLGWLRFEIDEGRRNRRAFSELKFCNFIGRPGSAITFNERLLVDKFVSDRIGHKAN